MRVFLPIRPGFERQALNLILDRRVFSETQGLKIFTAIKKVLEELGEARRKYFGGIDEVLITPGNSPVRLLHDHMFA